MEWENLKINPEYEKILPKLSKEEFEALKTSIIQNGILVPLIVNQEGTILDGHNRYLIAKELGFQPSLKVKTIDFKDSLEERAFVISINLQRRNLNAFQKAEMGMALLEVEQKLAKIRKAHGGKPEPLASREDLGRSTRKVAAKIGLGHATFERAKKVIEEGPEKIKELCRKQALSIRPAYGIVKAFENVPEESKKALTEELISGQIEPKEIIRAIASTKAVKAQLEGEEEEVKKKAEELFKDLYYTKDLDAKEAIWSIEEIAGDPHQLVRREFPAERFKDFEEAQKWAVARDGVCLGKIEKWVLKIDPVRAKKIEEGKEIESEKE